MAITSSNLKPNGKNLDNVGFPTKLVELWMNLLDILQLLFLKHPASRGMSQQFPALFSNKEYRRTPKIESVSSSIP